MSVTRIIRYGDLKVEREYFCGEYPCKGRLERVENAYLYRCVECGRTFSPDKEYTLPLKETTLKP